jgi:OOP family OmpA-OmpF porin
MRLSFILLVTLFFSVTAVQAQGGLPTNPEPNTCYVRCVTPDVYETQTERVMTRPEYKRLVTTPATYKTVTERVLVKEGYTRYEFVPATFTTETVSYESQAPAEALNVQEATFSDDTEEILIKPESFGWEVTATEGCESDNPLDCQTLCYRKYDAEYRTIAVKRLASDAMTTKSNVSGQTSSYTKEVVATPAQVREITIDPVYDEITKRVVDQPAAVSEEIVPAEYTTITKEVLVTKGGITSYEPIDCELTTYNVLPINYELGSARLTAESRRIIDNTLVKLMTDRPNIRIELNAHTDSRGSAASNQDLSERRAQSVVNYLASKGISRSRLVSNGYGESQLKNRCADGVSCSEAEHAVNRRTEFRVINAEL